jgi:hypothetical protein
MSPEEMAIGGVMHRGLHPAVNLVKSGINAVGSVAKHIAHPLDAARDDVETIKNIPKAVEQLQNLKTHERMDLATEALIGFGAAKGASAILGRAAAVEGAAAEETATLGEAVVADTASPSAEALVQAKNRQAAVDAMARTDRGASAADDAANAMRNADNGILDDAARRKNLGVDKANGQYRAGEEAAAVRLEQKVGPLTRTDDVGDWLDLQGNVYDAVGPVPGGRFNLGSFTRQIDKHLLKQGVDFTVVDLANLTNAERNSVLNYIGTLSQQQQARIIVQ